jgi:hypothetical protein
MCDEVIIGSREKSLQFCLKEHSASLTKRTVRELEAGGC